MKIQRGFFPTDFVLINNCWEVIAGNVTRTELECLISNADMLESAVVIKQHQAEFNLERYCFIPESDYFVRPPQPVKRL